MIKARWRTVSTTRQKLGSLVCSFPCWLGSRPISPSSLQPFAFAVSSPKKSLLSYPRDLSTMVTPPPAFPVPALPPCSPHHLHHLLMCWLSVSSIVCLLLIGSWPLFLSVFFTDVFQALGTKPGTKEALNNCMQMNEANNHFQEFERDF